MFLCIMAFVFFLTFMVGDALKGVFETGLGVFSDAVGGFWKGFPFRTGWFL